MQSQAEDTEELGMPERNGGQGSVGASAAKSNAMTSSSTTGNAVGL